MALTFNLDGFHNRTKRDWLFAKPAVNGIRSHGRSGPETYARKHAQEYGAAGMWRADDSFVLFYRDFDGKIRQKTWKHARPA